MTPSRPSADAVPLSGRGRAAVLLGFVLGGGWLAAAAAVAAVAVGASDEGAAVLALWVVVVGLLVIAVLAATGAIALRDGRGPRRLATAALCTAVVTGWRLISLVTGAAFSAPDLGLLALFAVGTAILVLLRR